MFKIIRLIIFLYIVLYAVKIENTEFAIQVFETEDVIFIRIDLPLSFSSTES